MNNLTGGSGKRIFTRNESVWDRLKGKGDRLSGNFNSPHVLSDVCDHAVGTASWYMEALDSPVQRQTWSIDVDKAGHAHRIDILGQLTTNRLWLNPTIIRVQNWFVYISMSSYRRTSIPVIISCWMECRADTISSGRAVDESLGTSPESSHESWGSSPSRVTSHWDQCSSRVKSRVTGVSSRVESSHTKLSSHARVRHYIQYSALLLLVDGDAILLASYKINKPETGPDA